MLAFMGTQSFIMMYQAGEGWQYGKRKQSAMSNEEFNKQTPLSIMDRQRTELIKALPSIQDSMNAMTPLIDTIVTQYGDFIREAIKATPKAIENATSGNPLIPLAFGAGNTSSGADDLTTALIGLAKWLTGGPIIKPIISGPGPNPETESERIANDKLIQQQTTQATQKTHAEIREQNIFGNVVPANPVIGISTKQTDSYIQAQYQNNTFTLLTELKKYRTELTALTARARSMGSGGAAAVKSIRDRANTNFYRVQKLLQNHITQGRNNIKTRALANRDWNDRIWNI